MPESCVFGMTMILLGGCLLLAWLARREKRELRPEPPAPLRRRTWYQQVTEPTREEQCN